MLCRGHVETCRQMQNAIHQNTATRNSVPRIDPTMIPVSLAARISTYKSGFIYNHDYGETYTIEKLVFVHAQALILTNMHSCRLDIHWFLQFAHQQLIYSFLKDLKHNVTSHTVNSIHFFNLELHLSS